MITVWGTPIVATVEQVVADLKLERFEDGLLREINNTGADLIRITPITGSLLLYWAVGGVMALNAAFIWVVFMPPRIVIGVSAVACCMCLNLWRHEISLIQGSKGEL